MTATMTCGFAEWECDLLDHTGCTARPETPRPLLRPPAPVRPRPNRPNLFIAAGTRPTAPARPVWGVTLAERRQAEKEAKRTREHIQQATRKREQDAAAERRRQTDRAREAASKAGLLTPAQSQLREVEWQSPSQSVRNPSRPLPGCQRLRVWELARHVGMTSAQCVQALRDAGEWVTGAQAMVVAPVVRQFIATHGK